MASPNLNDQMIQEQIAKARRAAKIADSQEPRAESVYYDFIQKKIFINLKNGSSFAFPPDLVQGLSGEDEKLIADVEITPSREGLHWEKLDVDLSIPALLVGIFGTKAWMSQIGSKGGSVSSELKAKAARENGKKGGRPKKSKSLNDYLT
ncbi:MAG: DUF2442 domain-containing protein [Microcystaceae cyanobacterium]